MFKHRVFWPGLTVYWLLIIVGVGLTCLAPGCASNPVNAAQDTEQRAYAVYGSFVIMEEQGARLVSDPNIPVRIKIAIQGADAKAKPSADGLLKALNDFLTAKATLATGATASDPLSVASANLNTWITQATTDTQGLIAAVKAAPGH